MKIAQVIPLLTTIPATKYGGIERVVEELTKRLAMDGHEVTVYCAGESTLSGKNIKLIECTAYPTFKNLPITRESELNQFIRIIKDQKNYDLIHFHYEPKIANFNMDGIDKNFFNEIDVPFLSTFHNITNIPEHVEFYKTHKKLWKYNYVFLSNAHRAPLDFLPNTQIINNGIDISKYEFNPNPDEYAVFLGRIYKPKGILEAIEICKATNTPLKIAAHIPDSDKEFYEKEVKPLIDGHLIQYIGEVDDLQKNDLLGNAKFMLCPISWAEPFGLVAIEAMACGTPVIAFENGALPEIILDGKTGFIVKDTNEAIKKVKDILMLSRQDCRSRVQTHYTAERMYQNYLEIYRKLI